MFFSYYTIGEEREKSDSVFVYFHHVNPHEILSMPLFVDPLVRYINEDDSLYLPNQRKSLPPGLDVYFYAWEHIVVTSRIPSLAHQFPAFYYDTFEPSLYGPVRERFASNGIMMDSVSQYLYKLSASE
jgi:hypothetical protein